MWSIKSMSTLWGGSDGTVNRKVTFTQPGNLHLKRLGSPGLGRPSLKDLGLPFPCGKKFVNPKSEFALGLFLAVACPVIAKCFS